MAGKQSTVTPQDWIPQILSAVIYNSRISGVVRRVQAGSYRAAQTKRFVEWCNFFSQERPKQRHHRQDFAGKLPHVICFQHLRFEVEVIDLPSGNGKLPLFGINLDRFDLDTLLGRDPNPLPWAAL